MVEVRNYLDGIDLFLGELGLDVEDADGVDLIAKEVDTVGVFAGEREDIEDATPDGELTWLVDKIGSFPMVEEELFAQFVDG